jgi:hypothetical protein
MYLKLRWARFFTLAGWDWKLSSTPGFDFQVTFPCGHSECGKHELLIRICEKTYEALVRKHDELFDVHYMYGSPHPALFGEGPKNTHWQMGHGSGGGIASLGFYGGVMDELWERVAHE